MRAIDADKLKEHIDKLPALPDGNFAGNHSALKALINMQPTIEPDRKNGKWILVNGHTSINCSVCHKCNWSLSFEDAVRQFNYCPNCGADMRGEQE